MKSLGVQCGVCAGYNFKYQKHSSYKCDICGNRGTRYRCFSTRGGACNFDVCQVCLGLGCIVALYHRSSASYQIH